MFKDYDELQNLLETADLLAHAEDWPELYDEAQLAKNEVPIYSAVYIEDMLVHFDLSRVCTHAKNVHLRTACQFTDNLREQKAVDYPRAVCFFTSIAASKREY